MEHEVVGGLPLALVEGENLVVHRAADVGLQAADEVAVPAFLVAEHQRLLVVGTAVKPYVHPGVQEARTSRVVVRTFYAHRVLIVAERHLTALVGACGIEADELILSLSLHEAEERVLPHCHAEVAAGQLVLQAEGSKQLVIQGRGTHLVALRARGNVFLRREALNLRMTGSTILATVHESLARLRELRHVAVVATAVAIEPVALLQLASQVPAHVFLRRRSLTVQGHVRNLHVPVGVGAPVLEVHRAHHRAVLVFMVEIGQCRRRVVGLYHHAVVALAPGGVVVDACGTEDVILVALRVAVILATADHVAVEDGVQEVHEHGLAFQREVIHAHHVEVEVGVLLSNHQTAGTEAGSCRELKRHVRNAVHVDRHKVLTAVHFAVVLLNGHGKVGDDVLAKAHTTNGLIRGVRVQHHHLRRVEDEAAVLVVHGGHERQDGRGLVGDVGRAHHHLDGLAGTDGVQRLQVGNLQLAAGGHHQCLMPVFVLRPAVGAPAKALPCGLVFLHRRIAGSILDDVLVYLVVRAQGGVQVEHGTGRGVVGAAVVEVHHHLLGIAGGTFLVGCHRGRQLSDDDVAHNLHFQRRGIRVGHALFHVHGKRLQRVGAIKTHHGLYQDAVGIHHGKFKQRAVVVVHGSLRDVVHNHHRRGVAIQQTGNVVRDVLRLHAATAQPDFHFMHTRLFHGREVLRAELVAQRRAGVVLVGVEHACQLRLANLHVKRLHKVARELYAGEHVCLVLQPRGLPLVHHAQRQVGERAAQRGGLRLP